MCTYLVTGVVAAGLDIAFGLNAGLREDVGDGADALGGIGLGPWVSRDQHSA